MSIHLGQERSMDVGASFSERRCNVPSCPWPTPVRSDRFGFAAGKISPVYTTYTLTDGDLHWVGNVPSEPAGMAKLTRIMYRSALDYVSSNAEAWTAKQRLLY